MNTVGNEIRCCRCKQPTGHVRKAHGYMFRCPKCGFFNTVLTGTVPDTKKGKAKR